MSDFEITGLKTLGGVGRLECPREGVAPVLGHHVDLNTARASFCGHAARLDGNLLKREIVEDEDRSALQPLIDAVQAGGVVPRAAAVDSVLRALIQISNALGAGVG